MGQRLNLSHISSLAGDTVPSSGLEELYGRSCFSNYTVNVWGWTIEWDGGEQVSDEMFGGVSEVSPLLPDLARRGGSNGKEMTPVTSQRDNAGSWIPQKRACEGQPSSSHQEKGSKTKAQPGQYPAKKETGEHTPSLCQPVCQELDTLVVRRPSSAKNSKGKSCMKAAACQWPRSS